MTGLDAVDSWETWWDVSVVVSVLILYLFLVWQAVGPGELERQTGATLLGLFLTLVGVVALFATLEVYLPTSFREKREE